MEGSDFDFLAAGVRNFIADDLILHDAIEHDAFNRPLRVAGVVGDVDVIEGSAISVISHDSEKRIVSEREEQTRSKQSHVITITSGDSLFDIGHDQLGFLELLVAGGVHGVTDILLNELTDRERFIAVGMGGDVVDDESR